MAAGSGSRSSLSLLPAYCSVVGGSGDHPAAGPGAGRCVSGGGVPAPDRVGGDRGPDSEPDRLRVGVNVPGPVSEHVGGPVRGNKPQRVYQRPGFWYGLAFGLALVALVGPIGLDSGSLYGAAACGLVGRRCGQLARARAGRGRAVPSRLRRAGEWVAPWIAACRSSRTTGAYSSRRTRSSEAGGSLSGSSGARCE